MHPAPLLSAGNANGAFAESMVQRIQRTHQPRLVSCHLRLRHRLVRCKEVELTLSGCSISMRPVIPS
jgi:hypothetical protein